MTSSSDKMARIWKFEPETGNMNIEKIKNFKVMLMNSKFNKMPQGASSQSEDQLYIATGGHEGVVTVWSASDCRDIAVLDHSQSDPHLEGLEIDWQNDKCLAVTGKSKNIYLWDITSHLLPKMVWSAAPDPQNPNANDQPTEVE